MDTANPEKETLPIKEQPKRKIKISKKTIFIVLLILSIGLNIFLIVNKIEITGDTISKNFKYITQDKEIQIDSNSNEKKQLFIILD